MTSAPDTSPATAPGPQRGPVLLVPVIAYAVLTGAAVIVNRSTPRPDVIAQTALAYDHAQGAVITLGSFLLFASAVPLTITVAVLYRRLRALGITAPGATMTLTGGVLAASALTMSGLFGWAGARLGADATPSLARALADLSFLTGGPGFVVMFALLIAGLSVPALLTGLLPRPLAWIGLALGVVGALSTLTLLDLRFAVTLPVVRFGGALWLIAAAALLARTRTPRRP